MERGDVEASVGAVVDDLDPLSTLFIVASKSGTTTEPLAFQADAWARIRAALRAGDPAPHAGRPDGDRDIRGTQRIAGTPDGPGPQAIPWGPRGQVRPAAAPAVT